ncbi:hypothetical protein HW555_013452, partial [Spodoptera exigua]
FIKGDSANLPKVDSLTVANFIAKNKDFCEAEYRNVKTSLSSRESYGDDAVGYVQLQRDSKLCTVNVTVIVEEKNGVIVSARCQDCPASEGGCKHAVAFLMWLHRRSEEPSCTQIECYWKKSQLSKVGTSLKFITSKEIAKSNIPTSSDNAVLNKFIELAAAKEIKNCELIRYMKNSMEDLLWTSMYQFEEFVNKILPLFTPNVLKDVEEKTRNQSENNLWHELRFGRVTASKAYDISRCKTSDGSLDLGRQRPSTQAMKRGRLLEQKVFEVVKKILGKDIKKCGLFISKLNSMIAVSPDGISEQFLVEIKCPFTEETIKNYLQDEETIKKMLCPNAAPNVCLWYKKSNYCIADNKFESNKKVNIIDVDFNEEYINTLLNQLLLFWKTNIYPLLFKMSKV